MPKEFILAIDQSTSGTKALLVNQLGNVVEKAFIEHKQYYPQAGWVEHDPLEIYENVKQAIRILIARTKVQSAQIECLTITNQRETVLLWDRTTGLPLYRAIVWQCQRTVAICEEYRAKGYENMIADKTGLKLDPYFSATKLKWLLGQIPDLHAKLCQGQLMAGTIDTWLIWKLSGHKYHLTDYTNASRTCLFNIHTLEWDEDLLQLFNIPASILPEVQASDEEFGYVDDPELFNEHIPITGVIGDSQAALFGQLCIKPGMVKATFGTGTSVLMNIGQKPLAAVDGLVTTIAWGYSKQITYAVEAIIRTSGDTIKWAKDNLGLFADFKELNQLVSECPSNEGVYLIPAFVGLGAPYWDTQAKAAIVGMNRSTSRTHIARAALESIGYQVRDALELINQSVDIKPQEIRADGGASDNPLLMQFQADIVNMPLKRRANTELSALGSVYIGGLSRGIWSSPAVLEKIQHKEVFYTPLISEAERERLYAGWKQSVAMISSKYRKIKIERFMAQQ